MKTNAKRLSLAPPAPARRRSSAPMIPIIALETNRELVDLCRSAALGFMSGARDWDKRQLADWLEHSYRPLVVGPPRAAAPRKVTPSYGMAAVIPPVKRVGRETLETLIASAHDEVVRRLEEILEVQSIKVGRALMTSGLVTRCIDETGVSGWVPVSRARTRLADRVMSLFAADFLTRPWDYEEDLVVCSDCHSVSLVDVACCRARSGARPAVRVTPRLVGAR